MATVQSAGLTQWSQFDVPGMWSLLRNVSTVEAFRQAGAWQSTYEAAQSLARRLTWYRDGLAGKWSPDRSDAASLYLGRLDELIGSAQQLADVSVSNREALVTLANAVDEARPKLQRVYEESQAIRQVAAQPKAEASVALRQQQLHKQATDIMESLGSAAMDSWRHYATADDYQSPQLTPATDVFTPQISAPTARSTGPIGEPTARAATSFDGANDKRAVGAISSGERSDAVAPQLATSGSALPSAASSRAPSGSRIVSQSETIAGTPIGATIYEPAVGLRSVNELGVIRGQTERLSSAVRAPRPSSVIEDEQSAKGVLGAPEQRLVNRVGGIVGEGDSGVGLMGAGRPTGKQLRELRRHHEYDINDGWQVPEGVPAVIVPRSEPTRFDPGPGVFGIDR